MTEKSLLKEVFTRLQKIFPDDVYISDRTYVIAGKQSKDEIPGTPICKLEKKYIDELLPYGFSRFPEFPGSHVRFRLRNQTPELAFSYRSLICLLSKVLNYY